MCTWCSQPLVVSSRPVFHWLCFEFQAPSLPAVLSSCFPSSPTIVLLGFPPALPLFLLRVPAPSSSLNKSPFVSIRPSSSSGCSCVSSLLHSSLCATLLLPFALFASSPRLQQSQSTQTTVFFSSKACNLSSRFSQGWWLVYPQTIPLTEFQVLARKDASVLKKRKTAIIFNSSMKSLFLLTSYLEATKTFLTAVFRRKKTIFAWGGHLVGKLQPNSLNWQLWTVLNKTF